MRHLTILILLTFPLVGISKSPCGKKLTCWKSAPITANGMVHALTNPIKHFKENPGIYYAFGKGKSCRAAQINGKRRLMNKFDYLVCDGDVKCGTNGGVYTGGTGCGKNSKGEFITWVKCDNVFHGGLNPKPQAGGGGAGLILLEIARRGETKARASRR